MPPEKKEIREKYNDLGGKLYDTRYSEEQQIKYNHIKPYINNDENYITLDHGCGTGLITAQLSNIVIGIDFSSKLIQTAKKRTRKQRNVHLILSDVENLPFKHNVFHQTISITVIQNTRDHTKTINQISQVNRVNATLIITILKKAHLHREVIEIHKKNGLIIRSIIDSESKDIIVISNNI